MEVLKYSSLLAKHARSYVLGVKLLSMLQTPERLDELTAEILNQKQCGKWQMHPDDILPLWVADMDFPVAEEIKTALKQHVETSNFGYPPKGGMPGLVEATLERLKNRYGLDLEPAQLQFTNSTVTGLYLGVMACSSPSEEVLMQTPIYGPFMAAVNDTGRKAVYNKMMHDGDHWRIDFDALENAVTPASRIFMLCNPHNPVGRVYSREELERLGEFVLKHRLWVISDELHADLCYENHKHIPFASLSDDVAQRTITLYGPTKAFNIAGLNISCAFSHNDALLARFKDLGKGLAGSPNTLAQTATISAYREGSTWLENTLSYLKGNRDFVADFVKNELPQIEHTSPEGTYLAWLDFSSLELDDVEAFLLEKAKVALNNGASFGPGGEGYARLNFATSRSIVEEALIRIRNAVQAL